MLQIPVKAAAVANLTDARYFAAREVEWIGFAIDPGNGNQVAEIKAMKEWLDGVQFLAEFGLADPKEIRQIAEYLEIDTVQVGHFTPLESIHNLRGLHLHKEVVILPENTFDEVLNHLESFQGLVAAFQLDLSRVKPGTWSAETLRDLAHDHAIWVDQHWNPAQILDWWEIVPAEGITLRGGEEEKIGFKSFDELDEILDAIEILE